MDAEKLAWLRFFDNLDDPRRAASVAHPLPDLLVITLLAVLCGADDFTEVEEFAIAKQDWLKTFLDLPNGIPSHDTFGRVFSLLDPDQLADSLNAWAMALAEATGALGSSEFLGIDGKTLRRSYNKSSKLKPLHVVSAWANKCGLTLSYRACEAGAGTESKAIVELLKKLDLNNATVTTDAGPTSREVAEQILEQHGQFLLAVKGNQPTLYEELRKDFDRGMETGFRGMEHHRFESREENHGRVCERFVHVLKVEAELLERLNWPGAKSYAVVTTRTQRAGKEVWESRFFVSSLPSSHYRKIGRGIRSHWGVENGLHWRLDVSFREDDNRVRDKTAQTNLAGIRRWAINLLRRDNTVKVGTKGKRRRAGWDQNYLLTVLNQSLN
jgi:predicted transposase YbfD/YdcC